MNTYKEVKLRDKHRRHVLFFFFFGLEEKRGVLGEGEEKEEGRVRISEEVRDVLGPTPRIKSGLKIIRTASTYPWGLAGWLDRRGVRYARARLPATCYPRADAVYLQNFFFCIQSGFFDLAAVGNGGFL